MKRAGKRREATAEDIDVDNDFFAQGGVELFSDQYSRPHVRYPEGKHFEIHPMRSRRVKNSLIRFYIARGIRLNSRKVRDLLDIPEAFADEITVELVNRSGLHSESGDLFIDLSNDSWNAVRLHDDGWEVVEKPPTLFRRFVHQMPLPIPDPHGDVRELLDHLPQLGCEEDRLLLLAWAATAWLPIPRPILALIGTHGAAKSTMSFFLQRILDPSRAELLGKDARGDLPLTFHKHAVPAFDNLDCLAPAEADLFCQAVTGRGIARGQLYTDADEFILSFQRAIIVNGLRLPTNRADFLDRCLILDLERIPSDRRSSSRRVKEAFEAARPRIVGGILNTLYHAKQLLPSVSDSGLGRMADFHHWGRAVSIVLGSTAEAFDEALRKAEARQRRGAAENTLAQTLLMFAMEIRRWNGTPTELFDRLVETAQDRHMKRTPEFWPESGVGLGRLLKSLGETLADHGVRIDRARRKETRQLEVRYEASEDRIGRED